MFLTRFSQQPNCYVYLHIMRLWKPCLFSEGNRSFSLFIWNFKYSKIKQELATRDILIALLYQARKRALNAFSFSFFMYPHCLFHHLGSFAVCVHRASWMSAVGNLRCPLSKSSYTVKNFLHDFFLWYVALRNDKRHNGSWQTSQFCALDLS